MHKQRIKVYEFIIYIMSQKQVVHYSKNKSFELLL